eukprot:scaffold16204_cov54-Phaeocystis_antarctica.AAC.2
MPLAISINKAKFNKLSTTPSLPRPPTTAHEGGRTENITLLRTLAGPGGTGVDGRLRSIRRNKATGTKAALPPPADWMRSTRLRHFVKLDLEAPVVRCAAPSFTPGQGWACCSSTACSALMEPTSMRVAPRAIPNVRTTRCT